MPTGVLRIRRSRILIHYGSECDASLAFPFAKNLVGLVKAASYRANGFGHGNINLWLQLEWRGLETLPR